MLMRREPILSKAAPANGTRTALVNDAHSQIHDAEVSVMPNSATMDGRNALTPKECAGADAVYCSMHATVTTQPRNMLWRMSTAAAGSASPETPSGSDTRERGGQGWCCGRVACEERVSYDIGVITNRKTFLLLCG